jgi:hypothetical protein
MIIHTRKLVLCLILVSLLSEISASFVLGLISDKLAVRIQDIQQLVVQEQRKAEELKALEQVPESVTVKEAPEGGRVFKVGASLTLVFDMGLSGEIIRTYLQQIVDLVALKNVYDLWKSYTDKLVEAEVVFMLIPSAVLQEKSKQILMRALSIFYGALRTHVPSKKWHKRLLIKPLSAFSGEYS